MTWKNATPLICSFVFLLLPKIVSVNSHFEGNRTNFWQVWNSGGSLKWFWLLPNVLAWFPRHFQPENALQTDSDPVMICLSYSSCKVLHIICVAQILSICSFKKTHARPTDQRTNGPTNHWTNRQTDPLIEMCPIKCLTSPLFFKIVCSGSIMLIQHIESEIAL